MTNSESAQALLILGYRDYIASRFLLNNKYYLQGAVLASSAVEKYLKAVLSIHGIKCKFHLDNIGQIKNLFRKTEYSILFDKLDSIFLDLLSKAYKYRYYDEGTITKQDTFGFLVNQFLGELDYTIDLIDKILIITNENKEVKDSIYKRLVKNKDADLWLNNYVLNKIDKKEFMERTTEAFGLHVNPQNMGTDFEILGRNVQVSYDGKIYYITLTLSPEPK